MRFEFQDINEKHIGVSNVISFELISEAAAACDGLRLCFIPTADIDEIVSVKAYSGETLIFSGFCDDQKLVQNKSGRKCFIYARSSASLLVDNEAVPFQYTAPSARQLCLSNAKELGFECGLPEICTENAYTVSKGTSCYGAINDFVFAVYGAPIYVTPENVLKVYEIGERLKTLESYNVVSLSRIISRSEPISAVDYKISTAEAYSYHFKSDFADARGIRRRRLYNLSSIPQWQREKAAQKKITQSLSEYYSVQAVIAGECDLRIFDRVSLCFRDGIPEEFIVHEITVSKDKSGEKTAVVLKKNIDGELMNYVA